MQNNVFNIEFDKGTGFINRLSFVDDPFHANLCNECFQFFIAIASFERRRYNSGRNNCQKVEKTSLIQCEDRTYATYLLDGIEIKAKYTFSKDGNFVVRFAVKNTNPFPVYFREGDFQIATPFRDKYISSTICERECVNVHIWTGLDNTYVEGERMGVSKFNVGLAFTKGSFSSYSQETKKESGRGCFLLNATPFHLLPGGRMTFEYVCFCYGDRADFEKKRVVLTNALSIFAPLGFTVQKGEPIRFSAKCNTSIHKISVKLGNQAIPFRFDGNSIFVEYLPKTLGEKKFVISYDGRKAVAVFNCTLPYQELIEKRIKFIVNKQQCKEKSSPLYGAYLLYDNEDKLQYFDDRFSDYNASRERYGMALLIAKWLQTHHDKKVMDSLKLFINFLLRESIDEETGKVCNGIGKDLQVVRLYNAPWVMQLCAEFYHLTKDQKWIRLLVKIIRFYYCPDNVDKNNNKTGTNFYPNGIRFFDVYSVLKENGSKSEIDEFLGYFKAHADNIVKNGREYPPHEVNFEQTIVTPALTITLDAYQVFKDDIYLEEAKKHLEILTKFDGKQPHYRLNNIPIRYWDNFWFGKIHINGDTFPHYWSVLSGYCYINYGKTVSDVNLVERGRQNLTNCTCNFNEKGEASNSYLFPYSVDDVKTGVKDPFANDQDFALYFLLKGNDFESLINNNQNLLK